MSLRMLLVTVVLTFSITSARADWPQWRGPNRDGVSSETGLLDQWPKEGPKLLWQVDDVGAGYSSVVVQGDCVYTQGDLGGVEHIIALDAKTGKTLWAVQPEPAAKLLAKKVAERFTKYDKDGDGRLNEVEAILGLGSRFGSSDRAEKGDPEKIATARTARLLKAIDANNDQKLTYVEAGKYLGRDFANIDRPDAKADAKALATARTSALVKALDKDGDGKISRDESRRTALDSPFNRADQKKSGEKRGDQLLTAEEIRQYLLKFEEGKDGQVSAQELTSYYVRRYAGRDGVITRAEFRGHVGGYRNGAGNGPRGTPTLDGDRLFVEGGLGDLTCLDPKTGKLLWHVHLVSDLGGRVPGWGYSESPLVEGELVIVTPGGKDGTLAALSRSTGEVVWRSTGLTEGAHYASPVVADIVGVRQVVVFGSKTLSGVDLKTGKKLWSYSGANNGTANCSTPLVYKDHVFAASSYGTGGGLARVTASGDGQRADQVYFEKKMNNHHGGMIRLGDYLYGYGGGLMCMNFLTGKVAWTNRSVGKGSLVAVDGKLILLSEGHKVALIDASPEAYKELGRFEIERQGRPSWAHPVVAGGRLYLRDQQRLAVYDIRTAN